MRRALISLAIAAVAIASAGCNLLSRQQELQLGDEAFDEALGEPGVVRLRSGPEYERVQQVARRIESACGRLHRDETRDYRWEWAVIRDDVELNAWSLPGGRSAVYTGMVRFASDDELAVVMGHEAAHAIARHAGERISTDLLIQGALQGASLALGDMSPGAQRATMMALGLTSQYGVALPWSRMQESEADEMGLLIAADAGYDPRAAVTLWQRMAAQSGGPPEFLSTHPSENTRIARLQKLMPRALEAWEAAKARDGGAASR